MPSNCMILACKYIFHMSDYIVFPVQICRRLTSLLGTEFCNDMLSSPHILLCIQCCNMYRLVTTFTGLIYHIVCRIFQYICTCRLAATTNWGFFFTYKNVWNLPLYFHVGTWFTGLYCWAVQPTTGRPYHWKALRCIRGI